MSVKKYFWSYNDKAIEEISRILKDPDNPRFVPKAFAVLSRTTDSKEVFSIIKKDIFIKGWPQIRKYWIKTSQYSDFRAWWETIYEKLLEKTIKPQKEQTSSALVKIGQSFKQARIDKDWSQIDLAQRTGLKQSDISSIESGKKNITLSTLSRIAKVLNIQTIELGTIH